MAEQKFRHLRPAPPLREFEDALAQTRRMQSIQVRLYGDFPSLDYLCPADRVA